MQKKHQILETQIKIKIHHKDENRIQNRTHNTGLGDSNYECINFTLNCYDEGKLYRRKPWSGKLGIATPRLARIHLRTAG